MKGYIGTIDSLNQLNVALLDENGHESQMEAVSQENADLVERQENMEEMLERAKPPSRRPHPCRGACLVFGATTRHGSGVAQHHAQGVFHHLGKPHRPGRNKTLHLESPTATAMCCPTNPAAPRSAPLGPSTTRANVSTRASSTAPQTLTRSRLCARQLPRRSPRRHDRDWHFRPGPALSARPRRP